jgi:hypothetical protein
MKVYAIEVPYEGVLALFSTRAAAEAACADEDQYPETWDAYVTEWTVQS